MLATFPMPPGRGEALQDAEGLEAGTNDGGAMEEGWCRARAHCWLSKASPSTEVESEPEEGWGGKWQHVGGFPLEFRAGGFIPFLSPKHRQAGLEQKDRRTKVL